MRRRCIAAEVDTMGTSLGTLFFDDVAQSIAEITMISARQWSQTTTSRSQCRPERFWTYGGEHAMSRVLDMKKKKGVGFIRCM